MLLTVIAALSLMFQAAPEDSGTAESLLDDTPVWRFPLDTGVTFRGEQTFLQDIVTAAGDINRDGRNDVLIGTQSSGTITVRSGRDGQPLLELTGDPAIGFGQSVGAAGDVDGDGYDDIIWGESTYTTQQGQLGRAVVTSGRTGKTLLEIIGQLAGDLTGFSVSGVGDVDGDGRDDVGVGSPGVSRVRVYSGKDASVLMDIEEFSPPNAIGQLVRGAGDVDGDSVPDVLIGILDISTPDLDRSARVHSGADGSILFTIDAGPTVTHIDLAMDAAGDVNADGLSDIVVLLRDGNVTSAGVFGGPDGDLIEEFAFSPFGNPPPIADVAGAGDVNGDGHADILVGTLRLVTGGYAVFSGASGSPLQLREYPTDPNVAVQVGVRGGGDVNGDGYDDLLLAIHQIESSVSVTPSRGRVLFGGDPWFIRLGDRLRDPLAPFSHDVVQFEAVEGTRLDVVMRSLGKTGLVPQMTISGPRVSFEKFVGAGALAKISKWEFPGTGLYTLRLELIPDPFAIDPPIGTYTLRTRARAPRGKGFVEAAAPGMDDVEFVPGHRVRGTVVSGAPTRVTVDLLAGSELSLRARATSGSSVEPIVRVFDPQGAELIDGQPAGSPGRVNRLAVSGTGTYLIEVTGEDDTAGGFVMRTKARAPRGKARIDSAPSLDLP